MLFICWVCRWCGQCLVLRVVYPIGCSAELRECDLALVRLAIGVELVLAWFWALIFKFLDYLRCQFEFPRTDGI